MPELPDIQIYLERLRDYTVGKPLERVRLKSPFLVRTFDPPLRETEGRTVQGFRRIGKRIVFELDGDLYLVLHLMISGRLRWKERGAPVPNKVGLAAFDFPNGTLMLTEASPKKRASLHVVRGEDGLSVHDPGGLEPLEIDERAFIGALKRENHTIKRALTDPHILSGIGNSYSDEILHRARLSPVKWTRKLTDDEYSRLYAATREVLTEWVAETRNEVGDGFPDKVTGFREGKAVHGRYKKPCPVCGSPVQRIAYADNEINYCATCQTEGKLLKDRSLSRLLKEDWPATLEELEQRTEKKKQATTANKKEAAT